ncbi:unnamed protein product [Ostreobium quekettii]|uniref:Protein kinase domain-containing protein n=1 Tax=Ostreobium quekettii TaxID=121088 RepID=A0A8S1J3T4_9CHLO|nr:unnamed protein product [Ostreobium quekettii]
MTKSGWMLMELADGDLSTLLSDAALPWPTTLNLLQQGAVGLEYVHSRQPPLIHGDVKDKNFLYLKIGDAKYDVKLADFGLTTELRDWTTMSLRGVKGTPLWQAPELFNGEPPSLQSDVFSFGLIMHAAVARLPLYGTGTRQLAMIGKKAKGEPPCVVERHHCPDELRELMGRCCALDPRDRPTMKDVTECLSRLPMDWEPGQQ